MSPERRSLLVTGIAFQGAALSAIGTVVGTLLTIMLYLFFPLDQMRQSAEAAAKASPLVPSFARVLPIYLPAFFFTLTLCSALSLVVSIGLMKRKPLGKMGLHNPLGSSHIIEYVHLVLHGILLPRPRRDQEPHCWLEHITLRTCPSHIHHHSRFFTLLCLSHEEFVDERGMPRIQ